MSVAWSQVHFKAPIFIIQNVSTQISPANIRDVCFHYVGRFLWFLYIKAVNWCDACSSLSQGHYQVDVLVG